MQSLDVISINFWQILISLLNLVILFLIIRKFLVGPVNNMLKKRQDELSERYDSAEKAKLEADSYKRTWSEKMQTAKEDAEGIIKEATDAAKWRGDKIVAEAKEKADGIVRQAENRAELELKKAEEGIKQEIVVVSAALAGKLINREINVSDHQNLIDSCIEKLGDDNDADK